MENFFDFFNDYIMGIVQMFAGFHYYTKFLNRKVHMALELLFVGCGAAAMIMIQKIGINSFLCYVLILIVWGFAVCRAGFTTVVLYAVVTGEIMQLCYGIVHSILCILNPLLFPYAQTAVSAAFMLLGNTAVFAVIYCCRMADRYFACDESVNGQYAALVLLPTLMIFLVSQYINYEIYGNTITTDSRGNVVNADHVRMLAIQLLGMASLFCVMAAYKKLLENVRNSMELSLLRQQEHFMTQYVEEAKIHYESTRSFRHDIRNHIVVVRELLQDSRWKQALDYVSDMEAAAEEMSFSWNTGNPVVDILVGEKLGIAKSNGIDVHCSLALPYPCPVRDIDLCIILSNALDNAVCACNKMDKGLERYIRMTGSIQGELILMEIENSFEGGEMFREGIGLSNIRKVAEKYQGAACIKIENHVVVLSVLLIIS